MAYKLASLHFNEVDMFSSRYSLKNITSDEKIRPILDLFEIYKRNVQRDEFICEYQALINRYFSQYRPTFRNRIHDLFNWQHCDTMLKASRLYQIFCGNDTLVHVHSNGYTMGLCDLTEKCTNLSKM